MALLPDDPIERGGWWIFSLPTDHPFQPAFQMHDRLFAAHDQGFGDMTLREANDALLRSMLRIAEERKSLGLKAQAYLYYGLACAISPLLW